MNCEHCVETINKALHERVSDIEVETDLEKHLIHIHFTNGHIDEAGVRETLLEAGYKPEKKTLMTLMKRIPVNVDRASCPILPADI